jgi:hypothetical protein
MIKNDSNPSIVEPLFPLGQVVATPGVVNALMEHGIPAGRLIYRHVTGDWGDLCEHDKHQNLFALRSGLRILSSYQISPTTKIWIITDADRASTTLLLPDEY